MDCVYHPTNNMTLGPPADGSLPECKTISATMVLTEDGPIIQTFWALTPEDVDKINKGGKIMMQTWGAAFIPTAFEVLDGVS